MTVISCGAALLFTLLELGVTQLAPLSITSPAFPVSATRFVGATETGSGKDFTRRNKPTDMLKELTAANPSFGASLALVGHHSVASRKYLWLEYGVATAIRPHSVRASYSPYLVRAPSQNLVF